MSKYQNKPDNGVRYALDDTIIESPIRKTSIKVKGVTYFDRQENLKKLYEQKLSKEDKHLRLEKFYLGKTQTLCVLFNDLEIGTIPLDQLDLFFSPDYTYELTNIHIGIIKDENDNDIYFARLFVIFKEKQSKSLNQKPQIKQSVHDTIAAPQKVVESSNTETKNISKKASKKDSQEDNNSKPISLIPVLVPQKEAQPPEKHSVTIIVMGIVCCFILLAAAFYTGSAIAVIALIIAVVCLISVAASYFNEKADYNEQQLKNAKKEKDEYSQNTIKPSISTVTRAYIHQNSSSFSKTDRELIELYRSASDDARENVFLCLSLEPVVEKRKDVYKEYSLAETQIIYSYNNSSLTIQNKVKEILRK